MRKRRASGTPMLIELLVVIVFASGCMSSLQGETNAIIQETTVTTVSSSTTTTSTTTSATVPSTTTSSLSMVAPVSSTTTVTTTSSSSTITESNLTVLSYDCNRSSDCGSERTYLKCGGKSILRFTETPICKFSSAGSYCTNKLKYETYEVCGDRDVCDNEVCVRVTTTIASITTTTAAKIKLTIPTSTTTLTIPTATFCWSRDYATSQGDCSGLRCPKGECIYAGEGETGYCRCKY